MISGKLVWCGPPLAADGHRLPLSEMPALRETFGRPIVMCRIRDEGPEVDIARKMARDGYAHLYEDESGVKSIYNADVDQALSARVGLHAGELLPPWLWRNDPAVRCAFLDRIGFEKMADRIRRSCSGFETPANDNAAPDAAAPSAPT